MTSSIEIFTNLVARIRPAVTNKAASVPEREHEASNFGGEWMMLPIASRLHPQHLPCRVGGRQRVQHRKNRRRPDSRAEQYHWALSGVQNEASARRADVESITDADMLAEVSSSRPVRLDLHADSIAPCRRWPRQRVAAKKWRPIRGPLKTQDHVLAWQSGWQRLTVRVLHRQRKDVRALVIDRCHCERPKSWCNRMRSSCWR